jgi:hypothetical protein
MNAVPNLMDRPDLFLIAFMLFALAVIAIFGATAAFAPGVAQRQFVKDLLANPVIQEKLKDQEVDTVALMNIILQQNRARESSVASLPGLLAKVNQDITWDVSGLIGVLVTVVLMALMVTQKSENIPKEVLAGWTTILGFYFGKASRK